MAPSMYYTTTIACLLVTGTIAVAEPKLPTAQQLLDEAGNRIMLQQQLYGDVYLDSLETMQAGVNALSVAAGMKELLDELCAEQAERCGDEYSEHVAALAAVTEQFAEVMERHGTTAGNLAAAHTIGLDFLTRLRDYFAAQEKL